MQSPTFADAVVVGTGPQGYYTTIDVGQHSFVADEPVELGGTDRGPTPYDYLLASLGACTSMTLRMYADRKAWPLDSISVRTGSPRDDRKSGPNLE